MATKQPFPHRRFFLKNREPSELAHILRNREHKHQKVLLDIDGTLHQGLYDRFLRGVTNADLAWYLLQHIPWKQKYSFFLDNLRIFLYDRKTLANGVSDDEREIHSSYLVQSFFSALKDIPQELIHEGAKQLPLQMYPLAEDIIQDIRGRKALISCGLQAVVDAYCSHLHIPEGYGNPFPPMETQYGELYGVKDKERVADMICSSPKIERIVVIGDTTDDVGMAHVAHRVNKESVVIALHHRSEALEAKADIIAYRWDDLAYFLQEY